ncbi:hypothetical protein CEP54_015276 [Fusarium duplospermum]|uniref:Clr5 domain-containing protein n=1 Tax=Fusarium duplospermum TaxID=1325734 RepID=A0A428NQE3_9HYPO|nr:hypothetical protein CEP54_015276 [Fusarium duplospermum]
MSQSWFPHAAMQMVLQGTANCTTEVQMQVPPVDEVVASFQRPIEPSSHRPIEPSSHRLVEPRSQRPVEPMSQLAGPAVSRGPSRRVSRQEWDSHKEVIKAQYPLKTLPQLREFMAEKHQFTASDQQWKKKLKEWRLKKNLPKDVPKFVGKKGQRRLQLEGKKTKFFIGGEEVPTDKVNRYMEACQGTPSLQSPRGDPPAGVTWCTYESSRSPSLRTRAQPLIPPPARHSTQPPIQQTPNLSNASINSPQMAPEFNIHQLQMAFWNGKDADDLLAAAEHASQLSLKGDYLNAKPIFMECLDGLEALLSPLHAQFEGVLQDYVEAAVKHEDFDEATDRVHKSFNAHQERLGLHDKKVWKSLARLGRLYYDRGATSQASHMLRNARQGLLAATSNDPEEAYICVRGVTSTIAAIAVKQLDFDEAEKEFLGLIRQAEALGEAYRDDALRYKHDLVHFYQGDLFDDQHAHGHATPKRSHLERLLLEILQFNSTTPQITYMQACSWNRLREFYESTGQREKLIKLLKELEDFLSDTRARGPDYDRQVRHTYKENMVNSFVNLQEFERAEWWLLRLRDEVEQQTFQHLSIMMQLARVYFLLDKPDEAKACLKEAQKMGTEILPPEHSFHSTVKQSIQAGKIVEQCCPTCRVNPPGNIEMRTVDQAHETEVAENDEGSEADSEADSEESHEETGQDQLVLASEVIGQSPFSSIGQQECGYSMLEE